MYLPTSAKLHGPMPGNTIAVSPCPASPSCEALCVFSMVVVPRSPSDARAVGDLVQRQLLQVQAVGFPVAVQREAVDHVHAVRALVDGQQFAEQLPPEVRLAV